MTSLLVQDEAIWIGQRNGLPQINIFTPTATLNDAVPERFRGLDRAPTGDLAQVVWRNVNLKNLHDHIIHARPRADLIVRKGPGHAITAITPNRPELT